MPFQRRRCAMQNALKIAGVVSLICALSVQVNRVQAQAPGVSPTEDATAREEFLQGRKYYQAGNYEAALSKFREAYEICGRPEMLYNIGQATDQLGKAREAVTAYKVYLDAVPDSPRYREVNARVKELNEALASGRKPAPIVETEETDAEKVLQDPFAAAEQKAKAEKRKSRLWHIGPALLAGAGAGLVLTAIVARDDGCTSGDAFGCNTENKVKLGRILPVAIIGASALVGSGIWWGVGTKRRNNEASDSDKMVGLSVGLASAKLRLKF